MQMFEIEVIDKGEVIDYIYKQFDSYDTASNWCHYCGDEYLSYRVICEEE